MSQRFTPNWADTGNIVRIVHDPIIGTTFGYCKTPPSAKKGYAPGCILIDRDATFPANILVNSGTLASCTFTPLTGVDLSGLTALASELNRLDDDNAVLSTLAGTGITGGVGTIYKTSVLKIGSIFHTTIYIDITGLAAVATDGDIIGDSTNPAHLGQITAARNGTIESMRVVCEELPAAASPDIDIFRATVATGKLDDAMSGITGQAVAITAGGNWANGTVKCATAVPAANDYLYLANGAGSGNGTYTGGKFRMELIGY